MISRAPIAEPIQMPAASTAGPEPGAGGVQTAFALQSPLPPAAAGRRRALVVLLAVAWCAALAWLALATSNPVTLNRAQIRGADAVITARIEDLAAGRCRVVKQWTGEAVPNELVVRGMDQSAAREEGEWILPLHRSHDGFELQPGALPSQTRLVYPATPEAVDQLRKLVD